jgi:surfeit locus 1 family protein
VATPDGNVTIIGLLRKSEPKGRFLQANIPAQDRWYSRDIAALSSTRGISGTAAWFLDARGARVAGQPVPGLTVITFPNSHLQYALTWFALAGLCMLGAVLVMRRRD